MRGYEIADCASCGHRMVAAMPQPDHVAATYDDSYFTGGGAGYSDYLAEGRLLRARGKRYGDVLAKRATPRRVLDVGAAAGFVLQGLTDAGWTGVGVEPNAAMAAYAGTEQHLDVATGPFETAAPPGPYDALTMIQVIAHFVDPAEAVRRAGDLLRPGGLLLIETWDRASRTARLAGTKWHEYSPPSVLHWFDRPGLDRLATTCGFEVVDHGRMIKWIGGGHARSALEHALGRTGAALAKIVPERLSIPYPSEDLFWALYRRS